MWLVTILAGLGILGILHANEHFEFLPWNIALTIARWMTSSVKVFFFWGWLIGVFIVMVGVFREFGRRKSQ